MRRTLPILVALLATSAPLGAADLEPARDALRRHEYGRAAELLRTPAAGGDAEAAFLLAQLLRYGRGRQPGRHARRGRMRHFVAAGH
jgi:hypothetical protein